jgi:hypothetical protein
MINEATYTVEVISTPTMVVVNDQTNSVTITTGAVVLSSAGMQGPTGATGATGPQGPAGAGADIDQDTGWSITGAYTPRKTLDPTTATQQQIKELLCTLVDLLKTSTLPGA